MPIVISRVISEKLANKHGVSEREVEQCFDNRGLGFLEETREEHKTDPATLWFIAPTNKNRILKICFVPRGEHLHIRTAFEPNKADIDIYLATA